MVFRWFYAEWLNVANLKIGRLFDVVWTLRQSWDSKVLQDLLYWYDPIDNITLQKDDAQDDVYFDGTVASPENDYTYDAIYRLIITKGREHAGNNAAPTYSDTARTEINPVPVSTSDTAAMRRYAQYYAYDEVGNMLQMKHTTTGGTGNWTRNFTVDSSTNRLADTSIGSNTPTSESYTYDLRGNIISGFNHLTSLAYNEVNNLEVVTDASGLIVTYYQYAGGQRVRKVTIDNNTNLKHVRKYLGTWEIYQKIDLGTNTVLLERESYHISDDNGRIALIDTPTILPSGSAEEQLLRYQLGNFLGSAALELDESAAVISYEEYYAFGSTSFQCGRSGAEVSLKRYRFAGKERDKETGLYYIGARYYAPWLARWAAADIYEGELSPLSPYTYVENNPVIMEDDSGMKGTRIKPYQLQYKDKESNVVQFINGIPHIFVELFTVFWEGANRVIGWWAPAPQIKAANREKKKEEKEKKKEEKKKNNSGSTPANSGNSVNSNSTNVSLESKSDGDGGGPMDDAFYAAQGGTRTGSGKPAPKPWWKELWKNVKDWWKSGGGSNLDRLNTHFTNPFNDTFNPLHHLYKAGFGYATGTDYTNGEAMSKTDVTITFAVTAMSLIPIGGGTLNAGRKAAIWSSNNQKSSVQNAYGHWIKHRNEFPEYVNAKQFVEGARKFTQSPPKGTLFKTRRNGDRLFYEQATNTFASINKFGEPKTMFKPADGLLYWNKQ